jgi:hypothetical protein
MGGLLQTLEVIFEMQRKRRNEKKNKKENKIFNLQNMCVFFFSLEPFLVSNLITFLFFIHFKQFKML